MDNKYKKLEIELKKESNRVLTPWEIQDFIAKLASTYYKLDLINSISNKLKIGVMQENIFIIDESFNYNNCYKFLGKTNRLYLENEDDFKNFYHFGNPVSMFPSDSIINLNYKFKLFRELNKYLGSKNIDKIDKTSFHKAIFDNEDKVGDNIYVLTFDKIKDLDNIKKERVKRDIDEIKSKYDNMFNEYKNDELQIEVFKSVINENSYEDDIKNQLEIEEKYFLDFIKYFNRLDRPIIGIYDPKTNAVELLGSSFIYKKSRDERFLDIKEISHNSPPYCHLFIGLAFVTPAIVIIKNIIEVNKKNITCNNEDKIKELEEKNKDYNESVKELENLVEEKKLDAHNDIENTYTKNTIEVIYDQIINKSVDNIKDYGFQNNNLKSKIIEFEKYKK